MMRSFLAVALLAATLASSSAAAQTPPTDYYGTERSYSTAQVLSILGKRQAHPPPRELLFDAEVQAGVATKIDCGRVDVDVNVRAMAERVARLPRQLVGQAEALMGAMPMLTLCYASPSLCAEVKNVNFQIGERLKGLSDVCRSMDSYIASQSTSDAVRDAAAKRGWEQCVSDAQRDRQLSLSESIEFCKDSNPHPMLHTDIAQGWLRDVTTRQSQTILASMLEASGQRVAGGLGEEQYRFLTAMLGELKLDVNGKLLPVFPARPLTVASLSRRLSSSGTGLACNETRLRQAVGGFTSTATPLEVRFYEQSLFDIVHEHIEPVNVTDLFSLDPPDRDLACNALGRALGKAALRRSAEEGEATTTTALQNPAVPEPVRKMYETRAEQTFRAMRSESQELAEHSIPELKRIITDMAALMREKRRSMAATISKGQIEMQQEMGTTACESDETCQ